MKTNKKLNEGIRVAKEGIEECWDDMGGQQMTTGENGEQMSVTISMPGKNISVTTDSAEEIGNILRLAGINIGGGTAGDVDGDGDHDLGDHAAELSLPGAGGEEPVIYVGAGEGGGGEQEYGDQPSDSPLTTNAGNTDSHSDDAEEEEIEADDEKEEPKEATQTPKSWEDMSGNEHPGTAVKGDRYGNQDDKEEKDKPTSMYKKNAIIDKEVDESFEELDEESARILALAGITNEAQSAAQKAAFAKMIAKKNGDKPADDKADKKDDNKKPDEDGDGVPDWADKDKEVKEEAPAGNSIYGQSVYETGSDSARILALAGIEESKLMNSPSNTSMPEPKTFDSLPSRTGLGGGNKDYGLNRADGQGENPMGMHTHDVNKSVDESFAAAMGEYRKFVAENISRKK
jgi:hypothetical protein